MKAPTARQVADKMARLKALSAALDGKIEGSSASLSASYGLPVEEVRSVMRNRGVNDNG